MENQQETGSVEWKSVITYLNFDPSIDLPLDFPEQFLVLSIQHLFQSVNWINVIEYSIVT